MPKQITLEEIIEKFDGYKLDEYGRWRIGRSEAKDFITTYFTEFAESLRIRGDLKQHICAYNDGEQVCPCFHDARAALDEKINSALNKPYASTTK